MKKISYLLVMAVVCMLMTSVGCKKKTDENQATQDQYVGTYQGKIVYNDGQPQEGEATLSIRLSNGVLTGFLTVQDDPYTHRLRQVSFSDGVFNCALVCSSPEEEDCKNWNVSGSLTFTDNIIIMNLSGTFCGSGGGVQATIVGNIPKTSPTPDDSKYITFAQAGREWEYRVTGFDSSKCIMKFLLTEDLGNGVFSGTFSGDCEWLPVDQNQFWWYVSPSAWCDMMSASLNTRILNILADAKVGDIYETIQGDNTVIVTVLSLNDPVVIGETTYTCYKLLKKTTQFGHLSEGYFWGTFDIGMIKYEAIQPSNPHEL